jgi:flagellar basal body-associated protein FliL
MLLLVLVLMLALGVAVIMMVMVMAASVSDGSFRRITRWCGSLRTRGEEVSSSQRRGGTIMLCV